jgi:type I restriction enzyme R subunit
MNKASLSERDICTKFILPALKAAGWNLHTQVREELPLTDGRIYVRGKLVARGKRKRADFVLYYKAEIPIAVIEAKDNSKPVGAGMQQALDYARMLDVPCAFSSNGDGFIWNNKTNTDEKIETLIPIDAFPTPEQLYRTYLHYKGLNTPDAARIAMQDYFFDGSGRKPRYYQQVAINKTIEAIAKGQNRVLLVMATGTGKTYTAFQIAYRLWKAGVKKRILFLADRTALIDQTRRGDFKHFKDKMTIIKKKVIDDGTGKEVLVSNKKRGIDSSDKAYEIFLGLYQGLTNADTGIEDAYKDFSPDFFDLVIVDECHRGSADEDSAWRKILEYFGNATHIGLTATPRETKEISNIEYFGEPVYTYSLKQGIDDGFLAPYRVVRIGLNIDLMGYRPETGKTDKEGNELEDRMYNRKDFERNLVIDERTELVARKITEFLKGTDRFAKTIIFCEDIEHAERMRMAMVQQNADLASANPKYVMRITGDNEEGKRELDNFIDPEQPYPVVATTSELMTTGVDAQTCKLIVLDSEIKSMTKFKQIIGRGTRINEEFGKMYFSILDFRKATDLFADKDFDGDPIRIKEMTEAENPADIVDEETNDLKPTLDEDGEVIFDAPTWTADEEYPKLPATGEGQATGGSVAPEPRKKIYVNGVEVSVLYEQEQYNDRNGKPITVNLKDHTKAIITGQYKSLHEFITQWNAADRKQAIIQELAEQGVLVEAMQAAVDREVDLFDLICHVAFDQPPLSRRERANNVKKRNYFTKYGEQARKVLEILLEKYADEGIENIESVDVLRSKPLDEFGSRLEIINMFGGKKGFDDALRELENELYKSAG